MGGSDGVDELQGGAVLEDESDCPGLEHADRVRVGVVCGQADHPGLRTEFLGHDRAGRLDTVNNGHSNVHQHDIGMQLLCSFHSLFAILGGADGAHVVLSVHDTTESVQDEGLVVSDEDSDHAFGCIHRSSAGAPVVNGHVAESVKVSVSS